MAENKDEPLYDPAMDGMVSVGEHALEYTKAHASVMAYGRLTEGIHHAGYSFERACANLEWLLEEDRWRLTGQHKDINAFLDSIKLDQLRTTVDARQRIASRIKALQPEATNRAIGRTLGVSEGTVRNDTAQNYAGDDKNASKTNGSESGSAQNYAPAPASLSGAEAAQAVQRAANKGAAQEQKAERREERMRELAERIRAASESLGEQVYGVLYADCPWRFEPYSRETGMDRAADNHYPTMTLEEIMDLQVPAADDCVLFLWATIPMLPEALDVMDAWGFEYKSQYVWVKDRYGTGYWAREQHEILLIGTKGDIPAPIPGDQYSSVISAPRGEHSSKPPCVYEMIEEMFPDLPRLEMFSRGGSSGECPAGWDVWGAEAPTEEE